ncbi:MAG TPA: hypothetical protein VGM24_02830 [Puia sp.]|jgi:hypothetical protein
MQRKKFIRLTALAATAGIAAGGGYVFFEDFESLARKIILKDTASLKIDPPEFDKFFKDVKKYRKWDALFPPAHRQLIKWHYYIDNPLFSLPYATSYDTNRSKIVGTFLLSTDFFLNKMDSSKPLRYRALFDPYLYPCSNPFSNLYYPA